MTHPRGQGKKKKNVSRMNGKIAIFNVFLLQKSSKNRTEECLSDLAVRRVLVALVKVVFMKVD